MQNNQHAFIYKTKQLITVYAPIGYYSFCTTKWN